MAKITLQFSRQHTITSFIISWYGHSWPTHVDYVIFDEAGEVKLLYGAMLQGGVEFRGPNDHHFTQVQLVQIEVTDEQKFNFDNFIYAQHKKPYDWKNIIAFILPNRDFREDETWFCSELIVAALLHAGIIHELTTVTNKITPQDALLICSQVGNLI